MKKTFIILLSVLLVAIPFLKPMNVEAVGVDTVARIFVGEAVDTGMQAVAEKAGFMFGSGTEGANNFFDALRQSDYQQYMNKTNPVDSQSVPKPTDSIQVENLVTELKQKPIPVPERGPNVGKIILSGAAFLTGVDLIYNAYHAFKTGYEQGKVVNLIESPVTHKYGVSNLGPYSMVISNHTTYQTIKIVGGNQTTDYTVYSDLDVGTAWGNLYLGSLPYNVCYNAGGLRGSVKVSKTQRCLALTLDPASLSTDTQPVTMPVLSPPTTTYNPPTYINDRTQVPEKVVIYVPIDENGDADSTTIADGTKAPLNPTDSIEQPEPEPETPPEGETGTWDWLKEILQKILDGIVAIPTHLSDIWTELKALPTAIGIAIAEIFIPSPDYFKRFFDDVKTGLDEKLPLVSQLFDFFNAIKMASIDGKMPEFKYTVPSDYGGGTYNLLDFQPFLDYKVWIINFIRFTAWYLFLKRLYNRVPRMVY